MSIRTKSLFIIGSTALFLILGLFIISQTILANNIRAQEEQMIEQNVARSLKILSSFKDSLNSSSADWSMWDDTYNFINTGNKDYITSNLELSTFENINLNYIIFINSNSEIIYSKGYDLETAEKLNLPEELKAQITKDSLILKHPSLENVVSGFININENHLLITSRPVTNSAKSKASNGTLIFARYLNKSEIEKLEELTSSKITVIHNNDKEYSTILRDLFSTSDIAARPLDSDTAAGYTLIRDIYNEPSFVLKLEYPRTIYHYGLNNIQFFTTIFTLCILAILLVCIILLQKVVVLRLEKLNKFIKTITLSRDITKRIDIRGEDDISNLASATNNLLGELSSVQKELTDREERLKYVLEGSNDGFWDFDIIKNELYTSPKALQILGFLPEDFTYNASNWDSIIHPDDTDMVRRAFGDALRGNIKYIKIEFRMLTKLQHWKWVLVRGKVVKYGHNGSPLLLAGTLTDISEQKLAEEEIKYLTFHDKLTGLFNRNWFESEMQMLDLSVQLPITLIQGDLNGLKMANDVFGHHEGDKLLVLTSSILKECCRSTDLISRWGGDEFVIILFSSDETTAMEICSRIRRRCEESKECLVKPSLALGIATKTSPDQKISDVIKEAEKRMYRNKLLESNSTRNAIISSLTQTLAEKSHETQEHTKRLSSICLKLGKKIGLASDQLDQLILLAMLHDIGKIGIPEKILEKPGMLEPEEWEAMKRHCEIGYRIAKSNPELSHIANAILSHHERFDGTGYPQGLKGDKIPAISRILAIVDSFDVMIHKRAYKEASSIEDALAELKKCSGHQFDPWFVEKFIDMVTEEELAAACSVII